MIPSSIMTGQRSFFRIAKAAHLTIISTKSTPMVRACAAHRGQFDDIEPTYPDGDIDSVPAAASARSIAGLPRLRSLPGDSDGGTIRMISTNNEQDNTPRVLPDGRVFLHPLGIRMQPGAFHHLWAIDPDGTSQMVYYGTSDPARHD